MPALWSVLVGARQLPGGRRFTRADERRLQEITAAHFPAGYTILEARGGWFDPARRRFVREPSREILVTSGSLRQVRAWSRALGRALRQKEMILTRVGVVRRIRIPTR